MEQFFKDNLKLLLIVAFVGNAFVILAYNLYRARRGKGRPKIPDFDLTFSEKWVSGCSHKNALTKIGGASNCLAVEMSRNALNIRTMFPLNMMPFEIYDLEHFISKDKIKSIQPGESDGKKGSVVIEFEAAGGSKRIELLLRKREEFLRALGTSFQHQPVPSGILT
jgi:hypothetical protein